MKVTAQFAFTRHTIYPDQMTFNSIQECKDYFRDTWEELNRYGSEPSPQDGIPGAWVWCGDESQVTDYPDFLLELGPRGGVRKLPA